ncbi:helix-turn-helix transcriptional regulator [Glycomyces sp. NPDC049804]|uniref:helix-turn-helix domain-containing protein n=1 Tax=Glycomyces sp. NPDC049804 TaxID=3154363 RepID=UPI00343A7DC2
MTEPKGPTWRAKWLGQKLRDLRKNKDLSIKDVADYLECGTTTVNRFEIGTFPVKSDALLSLMNLYGVAERGERAKLVHIAENVAQRGWWDTLVSDQDFADFLWAEHNSRRIADYQVSFYPGLLQHPDYAAALIKLGLPGDSQAEAAKFIEARLLRAELLRKQSGPTARFVIHEAVLFHRLPGVPDEVHTAQLEHLLRVSAYTNVQLRLLPLTSPSPTIYEVNGGFTILEMDESWPTLVHVETPVGAVVAETPDIDSFTGIYERLWQDAMDEKQTSAYLSEKLKEVER